MNNEQLTMSSVEKGKYFSLLTVICSLLLSSCPNPFIPQIKQNTRPVCGESGLVTVSIAHAVSEGRTLMPAAPVFNKYDLKFTLGASVRNFSINSGSSFTGEFEMGVWTLEVTGYVNNAPAARGSVTFGVVSGTPTHVPVKISPLPMSGGGQGIFRWEIDTSAVSGTITEAKINLIAAGAGAVSKPPVSLLPSGFSGQDNSVAAGYYDVIVEIVKGNLRAGFYTAAHVYAELATKLEHTFTDADFAECVILAGTISGIAAPAGYEGGTGLAATVKAYGDSSLASHITNGGAASLSITGNSGTFIMKIPADHIGRTVYFGLSAQDSNGTYIHNGSLGNTGIIPKEGMAGITLTANLQVQLQGGEVAETGGNRYASLDAAFTAAANGSEAAPTTVTVLQDITLTETITIPNGKHIKLIPDSSNRTIKRGSSFTGSFIVVPETASLTIAGNGASELAFDGQKALVGSIGSGVYISGGTFTMSGGTISGNIAQVSGGVYVDSGTFIMSGGTISGNTAGSGGGGVYLASGTFTMSGGTISDNTGGGVSVYYDSTFTMSGGTISDNTGGGVFSFGTFTMSGGTISDNTGGGVSVYYDSTFTMSGGTISDNTANSGGGVFSIGTFTMSGGKISGNTADYGGGVYVGNSSFTMSDNALVDPDNDVYLWSYEDTDKTITIGGSLSANAPVATITPYAYTVGRQVVELGAGVSGVTLAAEAAKFAVTPDAGINYHVNSEGKLAAVIPSVSVELVSPPETGMVRANTATVPSGANYSAGTVTWTGDVDGDGKFKAGTTYTATVTLTAAAGYTFAGLSSAHIGSEEAVITGNTGAALTLASSFTTETGEFVSLTILTQPQAVTHGSPLDSAFAVTVTYTDKSADYAVGDFHNHNIEMRIDGVQIYADTPLHHTNHNGRKISVKYSRHAPVETEAITVNRAAGAAVTVPGITANPAAHSITVSTASVLQSASGQSIEYAIANSTTPPTNGWQTTVTFSGLSAGSTYYVFARSQENSNYFAGTAQRSAGVTLNTAAITLTFEQIAEGAPVLDDIVISRSGNNGPLTKAITVVNAAEYTSIEWYYNNILLGIAATLTLDSSDTRYNMIGPKLLTVEVVKDNRPYSRTIGFEVAQ